MSAISFANSSDWLFLKEFIEETDGTKGKLYRCKSIWFMEDLGHAAKLDRRVTSTASVYFHRFFLFHSFTTHDRFKVAVACLFLAAKVEESPIRLKDIVHKFYQIRHSGVFPDEKTIAEMQKTVILIERLVLNTLNFDLYVIHPNIGGKYKDLKHYIPEEHRHMALQTAINFVNDSYRSTLCLQYPPHLIAIAMVYLSVIVLSVKPMTRSNAYSEITWMGLLEKEIDHITLRNICFEVLDLYELTSDKALKIKNKNFIKDQIRSELVLHGAGKDESNLLNSEPVFSPAQLSEEEEEGRRGFEEEKDDQKYEEESDVFHIRKVTVTDTRQQTVISSSSSSFIPPSALPTATSAAVPPSESPANGSESVYSTMSSSHNTYQNKTEYLYSEETPILEPPETPVEGGSSIYHSFLQSEEDNPSDTPGFHDLPRLPARERANSISEASYQEFSSKRPRLE